MNPLRLAVILKQPPSLEGLLQSVIKSYLCTIFVVLSGLNKWSCNVILQHAVCPGPKAPLLYSSFFSAFKYTFKHVIVIPELCLASSTDLTRADIYLYSCRSLPPFIEPCLVALSLTIKQ